MNNNKNILIACVAVLIASLIGGFAVERAYAQDAAAPAKTDEAKTGAEETKAEDDAAADLEALLAELSPEELEALVKQAMIERLKVERKQTEAEISSSWIYDPDDTAKATKMLKKDTSTTQEANIKRICQAFAMVDEEFGQMYKLYTSGSYKKAAEKAKEIIDAREATYLSAAKHFIYAEALSRSGKHQDAVDAYSNILVLMPEKISFAVTSSLRAAQTWEKLNRKYYAMKMYAFCLAHYGLTLEAKQSEKILAKVEAFQKIYKAPLKTLAKDMGQVERRLAGRDSGKQTQKKEEDIIALLEDLIRIIEEKKNQQQCSSSQGGKSKKKQGQGKSQQPGQASSGKPGSGTNPSKPMPDSRLESIMKRATPEGYRDITRDYHKRLAEDETGSTVTDN